MSAGVNPTALCQLEFIVGDLDRSVAFYKNVLGWTASPAELHDFVILEVPDNCPFGISLVPQKKADSQVVECRMVPYFKVENPDVIIKKAEANGGKARFGPKKIGGGAAIYQFEDPDGQRIGLVAVL
jgi:predicted enzyme related to lactoylglutathione lyase